MTEKVESRCWNEDGDPIRWVYLFDDSEKHWIIAKNFTEALDFYAKEATGSDNIEEHIDLYPEGFYVSRLSHKDIVSMRDYNDLGGYAEKTCEEWIEEFPDGIFCSTCY